MKSMLTCPGCGHIPRERMESGIGMFDSNVVLSCDHCGWTWDRVNGLEGRCRDLDCQVRAHRDCNPMLEGLV